LTHVFEHDAVVRGIERAFEVRVHDVDVFVVEFCASIAMMMDESASWMLRCCRNPSCWSLRMPWVSAYLEPASFISAVHSLRRLFMRAIGR
jgi:hypothetical protein